MLLSAPTFLLVGYVIIYVAFVTLMYHFQTDITCNLVSFEAVLHSFGGELSDLYTYGCP